MPNGLKNWTYKDLTKFLKDNGFVFSHQKDGSHEAYIAETDKIIRVVDVNKTKKSYPLRTLETMIRQSGLDKKAWREWKPKK